MYKVYHITCLHNCFYIGSTKIKWQNIFELFCLNFVILMYNLIKKCNSGWKITPFTVELVSNIPFAIFFECFTKEKKEKSVTLSVFSVLIRRSTLRFSATGDVGTSWLAHRALTHLCQQQSVCKPHRQSAPARAETDQFTPMQLSLQPFGLSSNWA